MWPISEGVNIKKVGLEFFFFQVTVVISGILEKIWYMTIYWELSYESSESCPFNALSVVTEMKCAHPLDGNNMSDTLLDI